MNKGIRVGVAAAKTSRLIIGVSLLFLVGRAFNAGAQTVTNLYSFGSFPCDGINPYAGLVQGSDGNLYGTTQLGGTGTNGTVFRISPGGTYTSLYSFIGYPTDGANPYAGLVQGSDGNFYGTTDNGGTYSDGTVFRISPSGTYTSLYSFVRYTTDGAYPQAGLVQGSDGNFYGTTVYGGTSTNCSGGCGTVFRISPSGSYTSLYSFVGPLNDGAYPLAGLVQGSDGNFYGTTQGGGTNSVGTVFRINPSGSETVLYSFGNFPNDGNLPEAGLVQGSDGNFYGTTFSGGTDTHSGYGTVFRISPNGSYSNLYSFTGSPNNDGANPQGGLVQGSDGNFYGTTDNGGMNSLGNVFQISPSGTETTLYWFVGSPTDGYEPHDGLVQGCDGNFYGTTYSDGTFDGGTVFKLTVPLSSPPYPINQITNVQVAATNIIFTIPSIAGETYQLQFSSSMNPTNWVNVPGVTVSNSIGALLTLTNFGGAVGPQGFYRFDITP